MATAGMNYFTAITEVLVDVQTELIFFCLAFATHLLFFSKMRVPTLKGKKVVDDSPCSSPASPAPWRTLKKASAQNGRLASLKAALKDGDAKSAMKHFEGLHAEMSAASASSAPQFLMEQLVKVSAQNSILPELLQFFCKLGLLSSTLDIILAESAEKGDASTLKEAHEVGKIQGVKLTAKAYQALIKGASACGTRKEADDYIAEAQREGKADLATYNVYLMALLKWGRGRLCKVRQTMEDMVQEGVKPNTSTFNKLLDEAATSQIADAWKIMDEMKAFGVKPDQTTCTILLKSRSSNSRAANLDRIMPMLNEVAGEINEELFSTVVDACVRMGRADLMKPLLVKQRTSQLVNIKQAHTYGSLIRACGYVEDVRGAWDAWNAMKRAHIVPISVTLGCMVEALVTNGDAEGGYELIQEMRGDEKTASLVNAIMYGSIVKGFSHSQYYSRVWDVYDEMMSQGLEFSMVTYNALIDTCSRSGDLERIPQLLKNIEAQGLKMGIVTYSTILKGYCRKNLLDNAFELFEELEASGEFQPDEIMYNTLLDGCARQGLYSRGMALFEKMKKSSVRPSNYTLSVLVKVANRGKKIEKAFELCEEVSKKHGFRLNIHVYNNLVQTCINHNDIPRALDVVEQMLQERIRLDSRTYCLLLRACVETRCAFEAASLLRAAMGLSEPHKQLAKYGASLIQPAGGLGSELVSETLWGIMDTCRKDKLAASLVVELGSIRGLKLDSKLRLRLTAKMSEM